MDEEKHKGSKRNSSFRTKSPSPDGKENPFVPGFGTKDLEEQQDTSDSDWRSKQFLIKNETISP